MSLTSRILIAMVAGVFIGSLLNLVTTQGWLSAGMQEFLSAYLVDGVLDVVGRIFVASLKVLVVPLVFVSLICGASSLGDSNRMGSIAGKTMLLYLLTTAVAVGTALMVALLTGPGEGVDMVASSAYVPRQAPPLSDVIVNIFPTNPVRAMADGKMLQIIVFALLLGYAISRSGEAGVRIADFFRDFEQVIMKMVEVMMALAPYGVFALLVKLFAQLGVGAILDLGKYFLTVVFVLLIHGLVTYSVLLRSLSGLSPLIMWRKLRPVWAFAFSTASSGATMPITMRAVERRMGVKNSVAGFTVPLGATINMDGTAIMQGVATVFIAQVYNVDIGAVGYLTVILTATLASVGTAAVPGVGLITLALVLEQAGLPVEGIALIIGVDRLLDMVRTAVNVTGDAAVTLIVASSEGAIDLDVYEDPKADTLTQAVVVSAETDIKA
ncbi:dicarboxylate/amino acid:cation symporter [Halieaceae bacterium IMCC14734]|uniref:Dicarboxylate/amino acid:cation symporter n=1 Tax=Candidatus Litorirhabdus singularis TaxID=2518993 RepID=A0ABT3TJY9_9GAMM|nr:dicarboxylate/amino acid:cation symporter [Candidatus Litorirhabdus singularis]MCX2982632.1 dicarboxylate/amino acid:cation symporter [Candidatus Litorirhabdus singularis]